jgi:hypothetical protein
MMNAECTRFLHHSPFRIHRCRSARRSRSGFAKAVVAEAMLHTIIPQAATVGITDIIFALAIRIIEVHSGDDRHRKLFISYLH